MRAIRRSLAGRRALEAGVPVYGYQVVHVYPHDTHAFTEGLFYLNGFLYESTGLEGQSTIRKVRARDRQGAAATDRAGALFRRGHRQLETSIWSADLEIQMGFVYDLATFRLQRQFSYRRRGLGADQDGRTPDHERRHRQLRWLDPETLQETLVCQGHRRGPAAAQSERARVGAGRDLRQRLADRLDRPHRPHSGAVVG